MATIHHTDLASPFGAAPRWLIALTAALTLAMLFMAVAETTLWTHFLVDTGETLSLGGLAFILAVGFLLYRRGRLLGSLALIVPWLLYPVITQGDQIIDNLTIDQMRLAAHLMLALIFAAPVALLVLAALCILAPSAARPREARTWTLFFPGLRLIEEGRTRYGVTLLVLVLLLLEIVLAQRYLGELMVLTLSGLGLVFLVGVGLAEARGVVPGVATRTGERAALAVLIAGVAMSFGLYLGFKHRPGAYQGSPHHYHDPSGQDAAYPIGAVALLPQLDPAPEREVGDAVREAVEGYAAVLAELGAAYHVLDRNYNYAFHNALFIRATPVLPGFRSTALAQIESARRRAGAIDATWERLRGALPARCGLVSFVDELQSYVAFNLRRAALLEQMSARFERTEAGLQHATHLYEGEGKVLGEGMLQIVQKHRAVIEAPALARASEPFVLASERVYETYANRIVGF